MAMSKKEAKVLLQGILNNDDTMIHQVIDSCFESAMKSVMARETKSLMESIGENTSKIGIV